MQNVQRLTKTVQLLDKIALMSDHPRFQMAAAIVNRNTILGIGCNRMKSHPFQAKYSKNGESIYLHAEIHAIKNALRDYSVDELKGSTLIVLRRKIRKQHGLAKPCEGCMRALAEFGITSTIYSTEDGFATLSGGDVQS